MKDVQVYAVGLVSASACVKKGIARNEIEMLVNMDQPTGVGPWKIADDEGFATGEPNPTPCNDDPYQRSHWLLHC